MSPHFFDHILYILDASEKIELMVKHLPEAEEDHGTFEGILYKLQTLSESASKLPEDIKQSYPAVKWKQFIGCEMLLSMTIWATIHQNRFWSSFDLSYRN